jgi:predicted nucleic acid-binding protein
VLAPGESKVAAAEVDASHVLVERVINGDIPACGPTILISEVKWFMARFAKSKGRNDFMQRADEIEDLLPQTLGRSFRFIDVDFAIAAFAADYRLENYSKKNAFSYNDGIYLATASITGCDALVTTDKHLLAAKADLPVMPPSKIIK